MKKFRLTGVLLLALLFLSGCSSVSDTPVSRTATFFDTVITIKIYDKDAEDVLNACIEKCKDYESRFSRTLEGSEIYQLNHAGGQAVELSPDTIELINLGLKYCELSEGSFDITVAPLDDVWNFKENAGTVPDPAAIEEAKSHVNYHTVVVNGNQVQLTDPAAQIDLGGVAKGYIADKLKSFMKKQGVANAIIDLGGNVLAIGGKPGGESFNIGIQKPFAEQGTPITSVKIKDKSVVSSGIYQRYFKVDDKVYHHILNPVTGYPCENNLLGVTIVAGSSADADGLSTTCFILGRKRGIELINKISGVEAVFITDDYKLHYTSGFKK